MNRALRWLRFNFHHLALIIVAGVVAGVIWDGWPAWIAVVVTAALVALVTYAIACPRAALFYPTVARGSRDDRRVALTFDDGPDPRITPRVLDALARRGARATFFVIGRSLAAQPDLARRIVADGHVLGNHSWQHSRVQNFRFSNWQRNEIARAERALDAVAGTHRPALYRPPVGLKIGALARAVWDHRLRLVAWSLHSRDLHLSSPEKVARRVLQRVRGGDIILLHDGFDRPGGGRAGRAQAVELILAGLAERGLECVTVPELLSGRARR